MTGARDEIGLPKQAPKLVHNALDSVEQLELLLRISIQDLPGDRFIPTVGHLSLNSDRMPLVFQERNALSREREEMEDSE